MKSSHVYLTTSIPYVNGAPHVGHAQELIFTDTLARLYRYQGRPVVFQTGTDENAFKNVLSARALGIEPFDFVSQNSAKFRDLADALKISYDTFLRTTEERHTRGVRLFWRSLKKEDVFSQAYRGLYCQGCEDFFLESDLVEGLCPDHRTRPAVVEEENLFFRLSSYQTELESLIESDRLRITPASRKNEILSFIRRGLTDLSLTRSAERSGGWGIPVPGRPDQVIYVWIDALINYLSGQGYGESPKWQEVWNEQTHKVHVIGKNVWKFHAIYWPALLLSAGLPLPNEIVIHGFLTVDGEKISKSFGNTVDPQTVVEKDGVDALRHYLLSELSIFQDADFSGDKLRRNHDTNLANVFGNLVSRLAALSRKAGHSAGLAILPETSPTILLPVPLALSTLKLNDFFDATELQPLIRKLWGQFSQLNAEINAAKPWNLIKAQDQVSVGRLLERWVGELQNLAPLLDCFLPDVGKNLSELIARDLATFEGILYPRLELTGKNQ